VTDSAKPNDSTVDERIENTLAYCLPSFIAGGLAMKLAPNSHLWSGPAQTIFSIGGLGKTHSEQIRAVSSRLPEGAVAFDSRHLVELALA